MTEHWKDYDPFFEQKQTVFRSSQKAVVAIAVRLMSPAHTDNNNEEKDKSKYQVIKSLSALDVLVSQGPDSKGTAEAFFELLQVCLWGNATDLSLLDNPDLAKVEELQRRMMMDNSSAPSPNADQGQDSAEGNHQQQKPPSELEKHAEKIIQNDSELLWDKVKTLRGGRVDIILDNAGIHHKNSQLSLLCALSASTYG